jgi:hypothetical protein
MPGRTTFAEPMQPLVEAFHNLDDEFVNICCIEGTKSTLIETCVGKKWTTRRTLRGLATRVFLGWEARKRRVRKTGAEESEIFSPISFSTGRHHFEQKMQHFEPHEPRTEI